MPRRRAAALSATRLLVRICMTVAMHTHTCTPIHTYIHKQTHAYGDRVVLIRRRLQLLVLVEAMLEVEQEDLGGALRDYSCA